MIRGLDLLKGFYLRLLLFASFIFWSGFLAGQSGLDSLDSEGIRVLDSGWEFYWKQLVLPGEFTPDLHPDAYVSNGDWTSYQLPAKTISKKGYATFRKTIYVDTSQVRMLGIILPIINGASRLYINDLLINEIGYAGASESRTISLWRKETLYVPVSSPELNIVLHISCFHHRRAGLIYPLRLGSANQIRSLDVRESTGDLLVSISLLVLGLFFLGMFFFWKSQKSVLYFALFCLFFFIRMMGGGNYLLYDFFPSVSWSAQFRLEYISAFLAFLFGISFVHALFRQQSNIWVVQIARMIMVLFIILTLILPTYWSSYLILPFVLIICMYMVYILYVCYEVYLARELGAFWLVVSITIQALNFIFYSGSYLGFDYSYDPIFNGLTILFLISMTLVFARRFSVEFHQVESLKQQLENQNNQLIKLNAEKNDFVAMIAHELKSPLNNILGLANILQLTQENLTNEQKETVGMISKSALRLRDLVPRILDTEAIESHRIELNLQHIDVVELVEDVKQQFQSKADEKQITMHTSYSEDQLYAKIDRGLFSQIVENLISNALKFSPRHKHIYLRLDVQDKHLLFEVEDEGPGISKEEQEKLFKKYQKLSARPTGGEESTGLGLSIVQKYVQVMGGEVKVASPLGKGALFTVVLPVNQEQFST